MPATVPSTREIGYVTPSYGTTNAWWQFDPDEDTPELQWPMSVKVYNSMRTTDSQVGSVLEAVTRPVLRTPWRLDPAGARDEVVEFIADDLGLPIVGKNPKPPPRMKDRFSWLDHLELALLMLPFGHMFFEQVYRVNEAGTEAHLGKLSPRMPRTIERVDVARDGGLISITQLGTLDQHGPQEPIPVAHLVAYVYKKEGGNWLGRSVLRQAYKNWLIKDRLLRVQAQTIERNGMGIPDYEASESETDLGKGLALATSLRAGEAAGVARPNGSKLRLMGVEGDLPDALPVVKYHDEQIARAVLAHFLNLDSQSHGSYALGASFMDFFTLSLQTLAQSIADTATMHIVEDLVDANWGESEPAPRLVFDEIGSRQVATAETMKALVDAGVIRPDEVLEESSRQQYGLPPADTSSVRTPPAPTGPTPQPPTQMGDMSVAAAATRRPVAARFNPDEPRVPGGPHGGEWGHGGGVLSDALKLAGKIQLDDGETLIGSSKVDGDAGGIRMAFTEQHGKRMLRLGLGGEAYGKRNRDEGIPAWDGSPSREPLPKAEHDRLDAEYDALNDEYDSAAPARKEAISARQDDIREQLGAADQGFNGTAKLDQYSAGRLADKIRPALAEAVEQEKIEHKAWDEIEALQAKGNPDPARLAELQQIARAVPGSPGYEGITFASGIIPGSAWGDVHWSVELNDPSQGVTVILGVAPKGAPDDWGDDKDWTGHFGVAETQKFLRLLSRYTGAVQAAAGHDTTPGHDELHHYWVAGPGLAEWRGSPKPFTTLVALLTEHVKPPRPTSTYKKWAATWFHEVFGFWPGSDLNRVTHGHPPRGHVVGPG
jgi:hypothetical protein